MGRRLVLMMDVVLLLMDLVLLLMDFVLMMMVLVLLGDFGAAAGFLSCRR